MKKLLLSSLVMFSMALFIGCAGETDTTEISPEDAATQSEEALAGDETGDEGGYGDEGKGQPEEGTEATPAEEGTEGPAEEKPEEAKPEEAPEAAPAEAKPEASEETPADTNKPAEEKPAEEKPAEEKPEGK